jgi:hypothetical protein
MSETVHYRGVLKRLERVAEETLEEQCKRLLDGKDLPDYFDSYAEFIVDEKYHEITIQNGSVYRVEKEDVDPDGDIFKSTINENGDIEFEVRYYNGGCGFEEALEEAMNRS